MGLSDRVVVLCLVFWGTSVLFSVVVVRVGHSYSQLHCASWVTIPNRGSSVESPSLIVGQCSHARPPKDCRSGGQVHWGGCGHFFKRNYQEPLSSTGSCGSVREVNKIAGLPRTQHWATPCRAYKDGEDTVPVNTDLWLWYQGAYPPFIDGYISSIKWPLVWAEVWFQDQIYQNYGSAWCNPYLTGYTFWPNFWLHKILAGEIR